MAMAAWWEKGVWWLGATMLMEGCSGLKDHLGCTGTAQ
jgi:hypothetical protein